MFLRLQGQGPAEKSQTQAQRCWQDWRPPSADRAGGTEVAVTEVAQERLVPRLQVCVETVRGPHRATDLCLALTRCPKPAAASRHLFLCHCANTG